MKKSVQADDTTLFATSEINLRNWSLFFAISLVCHVVLLIVIVYAPAYSPHSSYTPQIIDIDLGSLAPPPIETPKEMQAPIETPEKVAPPVKEEIKKKTGKKIKVKDKADKKKEKIKHLRSLKRKTYKSKKVVKEAIKQLKNSVAETRPDLIKGAIDQLRKRVAQNGPPQKNGQTANVRTGPGGTGFGNNFGTGRGSAAGRIEANQKQIYGQECKWRIFKNWVFSEQMAAGRKDLEVEISISISAHGNITKIRTEKESGNAAFDDSVYRAIKKANPLPPPPLGMKNFELKITFNPADFK